GPVAVAALDIVDPTLPLIGAAVATTAGALGFAAQSPSRRWRPAPRHERSGAGPLSVPALRRLYLALLFVGAPFGALTIGFTAFAEHKGSSGAGAWLLSLQALGALTGGLLVTHRPQWRSFPLLVLAGVWAAALAPLVLAPLVLAPSLPATPLAGWAESIGPSAALAIGPASLVVAIGLLSGRR